MLYIKYRFENEITVLHVTFIQGQFTQYLINLNTNDNTLAIKCKIKKPKFVFLPQTCVHEIINTSNALYKIKAF